VDASVSRSHRHGYCVDGVNHVTTEIPGRLGRLGVSLGVHCPSSDEIVTWLSDLGAITWPFAPEQGGHGCVNAGADTRIDPFALVCGLQRRYSSRSTHQPKLHIHETWAWGTQPFYFVYNRNLAHGKWLLVRVGWRYDQNWRGYIGPSAAWKQIPAPLLYY